MFRKESPEELNRQKQEGRKTIIPVLEEYLECQVEDFFAPELDFPIRPKWSYDVSREELERNENRYFHVSTCANSLRYRNFLRVSLLNGD